MFSFILKTLPITIPSGLFYLTFIGVIPDWVFELSMLGLVVLLMVAVRKVS